MSPARRRAAVDHLQRRFKVCQRRACRVVGQVRSTQRYAAVPSDFEARLVKAMHAEAELHPDGATGGCTPCWSPTVGR